MLTLWTTKKVWWPESVWRNFWKIDDSPMVSLSV
jgi:hypothetical protein